MVPIDLDLINILISWIHKLIHHHQSENMRKESGQKCPLNDLCLFRSTH